MERWSQPCPRSKPDCPFKGPGCVLVKHTLFFPDSEYPTAMEAEFIGLESNQVDMCRWKSEQLKEAPPPKPTLELMAYCLEAQRAKRESL